MAKLWKRNKGIDKGTSEIQEIIYNTDLQVA